MEKLRSAYSYVFSSYKRLAGLLILGGLLLIIPVSLSFVQENQDNRQRASEIASAPLTSDSLVGTYNYTGTCTSGCSGDYKHTMNIKTVTPEAGTENSKGTFSGTGFYNEDGTYTWDVTGTYDFTAKTVTFSLVYTGVAPGYKVDGSGTINSDGSMSGTSESSYGQKGTFTFAKIPDRNPTCTPRPACSLPGANPVCGLVGLPDGGQYCPAPSSITPLEKGKYELFGTCTKNCEGSVTHQFVITDGSFDGIPYYFRAEGSLVGDPAVKWIMGGKIDQGNKMTWTLGYTGTNAGYVSTGSGTLVDGKWSGTQHTSQGQDATWTFTPIEGGTITITPTVPTGPGNMTVIYKTTGVVGLQRKLANKTKNAEIILTNASGNNFTANALTTYSPTTGTYSGAFSTLQYPAGNYTVKLRVPGSLVKQLPGIFAIGPDKTPVTPVVTLTMGDVNGDNVINLLDYTLFISCLKDKKCGTTNDAAILVKTFAALFKTNKEGLN